MHSVQPDCFAKNSGGQDLQSWEIHFPALFHSNGGLIKVFTKRPEYNAHKIFSNFYFYSTVGNHYHQSTSQISASVY